MTARYLLCPGPVASRNDGDVHHVSPAQIANLYGVSPQDCLVLPPERPGKPCGLRRWVLEAVERGDLIALHPRFDGDYRLPNPAPGGPRQSA